MSKGKTNDKDKQPRPRGRGSARSPMERKRIVAEAAAMRSEGKSIRDIAYDMNYHHTTIWKDLKQLEAEWREQSLDNIDQYKAAELGRLCQIEQEAWRGWERSLADAEMEREETGGKEGLRVVKETRKQAGDPRFLSTIQRCVEQRRAILGLDAPKKIEVQAEVVSGAATMMYALMDKVLFAHPDLYRRMHAGLAEMLGSQNEGERIVLDGEAEEVTLELPGAEAEDAEAAAEE